MVLPSSITVPPKVGDKFSKGLYWICHPTFVGNNENKRKRVGRYWDFLGLARQLLRNSLEAALPALGNPSTSLLFSLH